MDKTQRRRDPIASLLWRCLNLALKLRARLAQRALRQYDARIPESNYPVKAMTVIHLLEKSRPKVIVELGSGESSAWFASYASKHSGTRVISIDEWSEWQEKNTRAARAIGGVEFHIAKKLSEPPNGFYYDFQLPSDADFIFLDGPYHQTHEAGMDVPHLLKAGHRPKVICVDGRTTGVDLLRTMTPDYDFYPQMIWCFERRRLLSALATRGQSIFVRR